MHAACPSILIVLYLINTLNGEKYRVFHEIAYHLFSVYVKSCYNENTMGMKTFLMQTDLF
jgi:hypothetical protein